jgi:L-aspartate oxidase
MFRELQDEVGKFYKNAVLHDDLIGLRNGIEVAHMVVDASLRNQKSLGCFFLKN